jgi:uncharacterized protein (DUF58 family)
VLSRAATPDLLAPAVAFPAGFHERLRRLALQVRAASGVRDGGRRGAAVGAGETFAGHRPYRAGEDLRHLDWELLARLDQPFVRVHRREAGERWALLLDSSASMGLGAPGKLQHAAEVAAAVLWIGARAGMAVDLHAGAGGPDRPPVRVRRPAEWSAALRFLGGLTAGGGARDAGLPAQLARARAHSAGVQRVLAVGDLLDLEPEELLGWSRRGRRARVLQVLAPHELAPATDPGPIEWVDLETGERLVAAPARDAPRYRELLRARVALWARACAQRGAGFACHGSARPFEESARALVAG